MSKQTYITRRQFLVGTAAAGAALALPWHSPLLVSAATPPLTKYLDALPVPPVIDLRNGGSTAIAMQAASHRFHAQLGAVPTWAYGGTSYLGPTILAHEGTPATITWANAITGSSHLLEGSYDATLDGASNGEPHVRTVVHLHGGHVPPAVDGFPTAWLIAGQSAAYTYPNNQPAASLWYHDHALGITRLNVYAGLAAVYLLTDDLEADLIANGNLPALAGPYDVPLAVQDKQFNANGTLFYPTAGITHPHWVPEFFGDAILVNGKVWPYLQVEPRKYRFRIYNGSNARFYDLSLKTVNHTGNASFQQIAAEQGFFAAPVPRASLLLGPGERADVVVDFAAFAGQALRLTNSAKSPSPRGKPADPQTTGQVMEFRVTKPLSTTPDFTLPATLDGSFTRLSPQGATARTFAFREILDPAGNPITMLIDNRNFTEPADTVPLGSTEVWTLVNTTADTHPIHLHLVRFQVLDRQGFDVAKYLAAWNPSPNGGGGPNPPLVTPYLKGNPKPPENNELGWKDTVRSNPGEALRIIAQFTDYTGTYPWHCHILEHEDNEMMRPFATQ